MISSQSPKVVQVQRNLHTQENLMKRTLTNLLQIKQLVNSDNKGVVTINIYYKKIKGRTQFYL